MTKNDTLRAAAVKKIDAEIAKLEKLEKLRDLSDQQRRVIVQQMAILHELREDATPRADSQGRRRAELRTSSRKRN